MPTRWEAVMSSWQAMVISGRPRLHAMYSAERRSGRGASSDPLGPLTRPVPSQLAERPRGLPHQLAAEQVPRLEEDLAHRPRRGAERPGHREARGRLAGAPVDALAALDQLGE